MMNITFEDKESMSWSAMLERPSEAGYYCGAGPYKRFYCVDPRPCYTHDLELVERELRHCEKLGPLGPDEAAGLFVISNEFIDRNNGFTTSEEVYFQDGQRWTVPYKRWDGTDAERGGMAHTIVICGKRIPIMPAMTSYIVSHEYGHALFHSKARTLGYSLSEEDKLKTIYMRVRGQAAFVEGKRWHQLISEIVANDFRTAVASSVPEFWPHDVPKLTQDNPIVKWWVAQTREEMEAILGSEAVSKTNE